MDSQNNSFETLKDIFKDLKNILEKINNYGFFQRLFAWKLLKNDSAKLDSKIEDIQDIIGDLRVKFNSLDDLDEVKTANENLKKKLTIIETTLDDKKKSLAKKMNQYDTMITNYENRLTKKEEQEEIERDELEHQRRISWQTHEDEVSSFIRDKCLLYGIEYIGPEEFPNKLKPDNSVLISEGYVIFDAKSPKDSEDTASFIKSINTKVKQQEKYTKLSNVKKDIYLVVPTNLYKDLKKTEYQQNNYNVWIITIEQIPVMLAHFKKTMDYSAFDGLSPEDRDALIKEIGTYAFNLRRRLMIDGYFGSQFQDIIKNTKNNLSEELFEEVEQAVTNIGDSLPTKRSGKPLSIDDVDQEIEELNTRNQLMGIPTPPIKKK